MGLKETQAALARLLTETELRERFFAAPESGGAELGLDAGETRQMQALTAWKVGEMARSLQSKRRSEIAKMLPRTCELLENNFGPIFRRFAADFTPCGVNKHREDALRFAAFLQRSEALRNAPVWRRDLLRSEAAGLQFKGRKFMMARLFFHDAQAMRDADPETPELPFAPHLIVWFRLPKKLNRRAAFPQRICCPLPRFLFPARALRRVPRSAAENAAA